MNLGQFIAHHRTKRGLSQKELGEKIGKSNTFIYRIESGKVKTLKDDVMQNLADALGIPVIAFFEGFDIEGNPKENVKEITRDEFVQELINLLKQTNKFNDKQIEYIISTINLFDSNNDEQ